MWKGLVRGLGALPLAGGILFALLGLISQDVRWLGVAALAAWWPRSGRATCARVRWTLVLGALAAYALGFRLELIRGWGGAYLELGVWSLPLSALWLILNAQALAFVHAQDESGRLTAQVGWVVCAALLAMTLLQPQPSTFALSLAGLALLGLTWTLFSRFALTRAASQGVGLLLGLITIAGAVKTGASVALLAPVFILGLPPLTLRPALGIVPAARQGVVPARLLGLYAALSAASVLGVAWVHQPQLALPLSILAGAISALALALGGVRDAWEANAKRLCLFGVPFDRIQLEQAVERVEGFIQAGMPRLVATVDTTAVVRARRDAEWRSCYERADLVTADGTGIVWASRWLGAPLPERLTGIDLLHALCARAARRGYRVFLLGAAPGVAERAADRLQRAYAGLIVVGVHHGYFQADGTSCPISACIRQAKPDLLFVGMGAPRQERWALAQRHALGVPVIMGVGGSFDVLSGRLARAPRWVQKAGLEWAFRLCLEPHRLGRALQIPVFVWWLLRLKCALWLHSCQGSTTSANSS